MNTFNFYTVIPVLNRWEQTRRCVRRLIDEGQPPETIFVVDHGSSDGTKEGIVNEFPGVVRLEADPDFWWTGATNYGIKEALARGADWVMLINNDCIFEQGALTKLEQHAKQHVNSVIAPVQKGVPSGDITYGIHSCFLLGLVTTQMGKRKGHPVGASLFEVELIGGGRGVLIPRSVFDQIGLFNEQALPHYYADHDFYHRCRKSGIALLIADDAIVQVDENTSSSASNVGRMTFSQFYISLKERKSHRNLYDLSTLFQRHYPIPGLWWIGVGLSLMRYFIIYLMKRVKFKFSNGGRD